MKSTRLALLVAAGAMVGLPAIAAAQDRPNHREHQGPGGDGGGRERGGRPEAAPAPTPAPQAQPAPPPQAQPAAQARPAQVDRRGLDGGQPGARFDGNRDGRGFAGTPQNYGQNYGQNGAVARRPQDQGRPIGVGRTPDGRGYDSRRTDDRRVDGRGDDRRGYDNRGYDTRGYDNRGYDNRGYDNRGFAGQQSWRNDRRYDWRGYRDQNRSLFHGPRYAPPRGYGYGYRLFTPGLLLEPFFYDRSYWIDDPYAYRLPPAEGPYRWVRYYDDVLLVDLRSGEIVDVIHDFFW